MQKKYTYQFSLIDKISGPVRKISGAFGVANMRMQGFGNAIEKKTKMLNAGGKRLLNFRNLLLGSFVTTGVMSLGRELTNTLGKFQTFEAVLTNTLGSNSAAKQVLADIQEFASRTPFQVDQLTDSWVKLANQGFRPNMDEMTSLGDLASSTGKDIDQLAEAVIDAQVGEFERLKEFGIRAQKSGDQVKFSFKGQTTEVKFTESAIQDYILSLGKAEGVSGSMAAISATVAGRMSNFNDRVTNLTKSFAEALEPVIVRTIDASSSFVDRLTSMSKWVGHNRESIFAWVKAIGLVVGGFGSVWVASQVLLGIGSMVKTIAGAWKMVTGVIKLARMATIAFNVVASINPFSWISVVIVGIGLILYNWKTIKSWLAEFAAWAWENHPFKWMIDLVDRVFPGFKNTVTKLFNDIRMAIGKAFKWLNDNIFSPFSKMLSKLFDFEPVLPSPGKGDPDSDDGTGDTDTPNPYGRNAPSPSSGGSGGAGRTSSARSINSRIGGVSSGGGKNITINIDALNKGGITVSTNTMGMSVDQIRQELTRMLLSVVNDVNYQ